MSATAIAAAAADLPAGMQRTIYLCDDGADPLKKQWCETCDRHRTLGCDVRWIAGRSKLVPGNGKSLNFNHALRQIYGDRAVLDDCGRGVPSPGWADIPDTEFIAGLDADMVASPTFFTELASKLRTPRDAIAQSAQAFWNYDPEADVTDNAQLVKYEICDAQVRAGGGVRCNGSGWVCRARAMAHAGWWRVDTTGEGQAMGIALERLGYKGYYSMKTLQVRVCVFECVKAASCPRSFLFPTQPNLHSHTFPRSAKSRTRWATRLCKGRATPKTFGKTCAGGAASCTTARSRSASGSRAKACSLTRSRRCTCPL